jgi:hypothetical protein
VVVRTVEPGSEACTGAEPVEPLGHHSPTNADGSMHPHIDLEPLHDGKWPRRLTFAGYLAAAAATMLSLIHVIQLPG